MSEPVNRGESPATNTAALESMHKLLLEALRHREQEIFRYLAILGPALGGFIWLLHAGSAVERKVEGAVVTVTTHQLGPYVFVVGAVSVILLLLLGAVYSLALGYNYRYIVLELAKLEKALGIEDRMLVSWPRKPDDFLSRYTCFGKPCCTPPEIIKVFWVAFLAGIVGVMVAACISDPKPLTLWLVIPSGAVCFLIGLLSLFYFGRKLRKACENEKERGDWSILATGMSPNGGGGGQRQ